jgi:hypothetical protein
MDPFTTLEREAADAAPDPALRRHEARGRATLAEQWIADEFEQIERELVLLRAVKRDKRQPKVFLQIPAEVLKAHEQGVISKAEARKILGLKAIRQPVQLRTRRAK